MKLNQTQNQTKKKLKFLITMRYQGLVATHVQQKEDNQRAGFEPSEFPHLLDHMGQCQSGPPQVLHDESSKVHQQQ